MKPNDKNFCGGNYQDWLEVLLIEICNGRCSWCVEKKGFHPTYHAPWKAMVQKIIESGKTNIMLLGGEPTLHPHLREIINALDTAKLKTRITTNGHNLTSGFVGEVLPGIVGVNISIHDHDLTKNHKITGIKLNENVLTDAISAIHSIGSTVRLNCNCIRGHIDSVDSINEYVDMAKKIGADGVRIAELKQDDENFVDIGNLFDYNHGMNKDPFLFGCVHDAEINGMPVNFRQMCGLFTNKRPRPENPEQCWKTVLYYDGIFYKGWQLKKEDGMEKKKLDELLKKVAQGLVKPEDAAREIKDYEPDANPGAGCMY